jgi:hypothetical protein
MIEKILEELHYIIGGKSEMVKRFIELTFEMKKPYYYSGELTDDFIEKDSKIIENIVKAARNLYTT